jgi:hypothetical protein
MAKRNQRKRPSAVSAVESPSMAPRSEPRPSRLKAAAPREPLAPASVGAIGAYLGMAFGLTLFVLGILGTMRADTLPIPLLVALFLAGPLQTGLCWQVLRRSRTAWSFAVALSGTAALVCLFSAPKLRDALGLSIGIAILPSLVAAVVTWLLVSAASDVAQRS